MDDNFEKTYKRWESGEITAVKAMESCMMNLSKRETIRTNPIVRFLLFLFLAIIRLIGYFE